MNPLIRTFVNVWDSDLGDRLVEKKRNHGSFSPMGDARAEIRKAKRQELDELAKGKARDGLSSHHDLLADIEERKRPPP